MASEGLLEAPCSTEKMIIQLYQIMMERANYEFVCPLCISPFRRYDGLYSHIKETEETTHRELAARWFAPSCGVCGRDTADGFLRHTEHYHNENYQNIMRETMRLRSDVQVKVLPAPWCCTPRNFFPYRQQTGIISLPRKKRKSITPLECAAEIDKMPPQKKERSAKLLERVTKINTAMQQVFTSHPSRQTPALPRDPLGVPVRPVNSVLHENPSCE